MVKQNQESKQANSYYPPQTGDLLEEFESTHPSYKLFKQKGLDKMQMSPGDTDANGKQQYIIDRILSEGPFRQVRDFLNKVDPTKGPIERQVNILERRRDPDPITHKRSEHLVVHVTWVAKDFLGNEIKGYDIKEGMCNEPLTRVEIVNGRREIKYSNWKAIYDIPFSKETVDEALENSINTTEDIRFLIRQQTSRDNTFSLEQFRDTTWDEAIEISRTGKGLNR